ncbi:MAG: spirocyclase AveC family protein [Actinomycetota bacterium]
MTATATPLGRASLSRSNARRWRPAHYLAALGAVFVFWQSWTWIAWLADGPEQITQFRDRNSASWYGARVYEALAIVAALSVIVYLVRQCRRERRLTFDAMLCISTGAAMWTDPGVNFIEPTWMYSSNWTNLGGWAGHIPFFVNPDAGRMPEPILLASLVYTFGVLLFVMILTSIMRWLRRRTPTISNARLLLLTFLGGVAIDVAFELPAFALRLWAYPGAPDFFALFGGKAWRFPVIEMMGVAFIYTSLAAVRFFRDDAGRSVVERGLEGTRPRVRTAISVLAMVAVSNVALFAANSGNVVGGFFTSPFKRMPVHIVNGICDAPGVTGTRYGPCPGSPGFTAPIRDLPGPKPYQ